MSEFDEIDEHNYLKKIVVNTDVEPIKKFRVKPKRKRIVRPKPKPILIDDDNN